MHRIPFWVKPFVLICYLPDQTTSPRSNHVDCHLPLPPTTGGVRRQAEAGQPVRQVHTLQRARPVEEADHRELHRGVLRLLARAGSLCGALAVRASPVSAPTIRAG